MSTKYVVVTVREGRVIVVHSSGSVNVIVDNDYKLEHPRVVVDQTLVRSTFAQISG